MHSIHTLQAQIVVHVRCNWTQPYDCTRLCNCIQLYNCSQLYICTQLYDCTQLYNCRQLYIGTQLYDCTQLYNCRQLYIGTQLYDCTPYMRLTGVPNWMQFSKVLTKSLSDSLMTWMLLAFSMFLIHLLACPWGSIIRGHRRALLKTKLEC